MDQSNAPQPPRGAGLLLIAAIFALALNLRLPGGNAWRRHPPIDPEI